MLEVLLEVRRGVSERKKTGKTSCRKLVEFFSNIPRKPETIKNLWLKFIPPSRLAGTSATGNRHYGLL